jgi:hypothetical protein
MDEILAVGDIEFQKRFCRHTHTVGTSSLCPDFKQVMRGRGTRLCAVPPSFPVRDGECSVKIALGLKSCRQIVDRVDEPCSSESPWEITFKQETQ